MSIIRQIASRAATQCKDGACPYGSDIVWWL